MNEQPSQQKFLLQLRNYYIDHVSHQPNHQELKENLLFYLKTLHQFQPDLISKYHDDVKDLILTVEGKTFPVEMETLARGRRGHTIRDRLESVVRQKSEQQAEQWFNYFIWCVPKQIREPWLGDLREDRERMANAGLSHWRIE